MKRGKLDNPTNVRFDGPSHDRLRRVASDYGLSPSDLIRAAVAEMLPRWEQDGRVVLTRRQQAARGRR